MSVAMSGAGGAGYMPMQTAMPQMRTPNFNNTSSNQSVNLRMPTFAGPTESKKDLRGDLSGDECLTLDVDEVVLSAIWIESTCECVVAVAKLPPEESRDPLSDSNLDLISLFVTETTRKLQQQSAAALLAKESADAAKKTQAAKNKKKKKDNSLASGKGGITLVLPSSISQDSLRSAVAKVTLSGFTTKNVFGRGIATITGVLSRSAGMGDSNHSNDLLSVLDSGKKSGKLLDQDPVVLHIYFRNKGSNVSLDSALVVLERGNGVRNNLGYERLCTIAVDDRVCDSSKKGVETALRDALDNLMSIAKMEEGRISAVVFNGNCCTAEEEKIRDSSVSLVYAKKTPSPSIYRGMKEDAVRGGCILSAAELDSSKEYLQGAGGSWILAYQLPVADGYVSRQIGLIVRTESSLLTEITPEIIFSSRRIWKPEIGPIRPGSIPTDIEGLARLTKDYSSVVPGSMSRIQKLFTRSAAATEPARAAVIYGSSGDWPRLSLVERVCVGNRAKEEEGPWTKIGKEDILPLMIQNSESSSIGSSRSDKVGKGSDINLEPVESCSVTFSLNPATGLVTVSEQKGKLIRDRRADYWFRVQVICSILLLILLLLSPFLYNFFRERSVKAEHIKWLKSFYLMHAPEKLKDPEYVERTVLKYKGRMFLLWRGLKRTYSVDFPAPSSILEVVGTDL